MGAEREDTDPNPNRVGTEPGLGKASGPKAAVAEVIEVEDEAPPPVDFDALHAALGDPLDYQDMSSGPHLEQHDGVGELFEGNDELPPRPAAAAPAAPPTPQPRARASRVGESSGQSSATYASARPHTIPPTRSPTEDLNAPPVIVASDDTVPSAPPQMTVPLSATPYAHGGHGAMGAMGAQGGPMGPPHAPGAAGIGTPMPGPAFQQPQGHMHPPGHPSSGSHPNAVPAHTPQPFPAIQAIQRGAVPQMTMRMPDRPLNMRRGKTPTIVVRPRGPSAKQKLVAFMAALLLVTAVGIAMIIWRKPRLLGLEPAPPPTTSAAPSSGSTGGGASAPSASVTTAAPATASGSAAASASPPASAAAKVKTAKPAGAPPSPASAASVSR